MQSFQPDNKTQISTYLQDLDLGGWVYYPELTSTNDRALAWATEGALDWTLVVADGQTQGRGREGRRWVTKPGTSLAMSLIFRLTIEEMGFVTRFTALAALGLIHALGKMSLHAKLKWPNDILLHRKKVGGVLVEGDWEGDNLTALVVGMGVNVTPEALPEPEDLRYPATALELIHDKPIDRWLMLANIIKAMQSLRGQLCSEEFIRLWNTHLAFRNQWVSFKLPIGGTRRVKVQGVVNDGKIALEKEDGQVISAIAGEILINGIDQL